MKIIDKYLVLHKISDDKFNGNHPNGINVGSTRIQGICKKEPVIGKSFILIDTILNIPCAYTSAVKSYDKKKGILKTNNSTYKIQVIKFNKKKNEN